MSFALGAGSAFSFLERKSKRPMLGARKLARELAKRHSPSERPQTALRNANERGWGPCVDTTEGSAEQITIAQETPRRLFPARPAGTAGSGASYAKPSSRIPLTRHCYGDQHDGISAQLNLVTHRTPVFLRHLTLAALDALEERALG